LDALQSLTPLTPCDTSNKQKGQKSSRKAVQKKRGGGTIKRKKGDSLTSHTLNSKNLALLNR
uniref:hypothetical protein n=1 Tax=Helicobacter cinaedi TaxID=213 RepID=UPI001A9E4D2A